MDHRQKIAQLGTIPNTIEGLRHHLMECTSYKRDIETGITEANARALQKQQECLSYGHAGKSEWFNYYARHKSWRACETRRLADVSRVISIVKMKIHELSQKEGHLTAPWVAVRTRDLLVVGLFGDEHRAHQWVAAQDEHYSVIRVERPVAAPTEHSGA